MHLTEVSVAPSITYLLEKIGNVASGEEPIDKEYYTSLRDEGRLNLSEIEWLLR